MDWIESSSSCKVSPKISDRDALSGNPPGCRTPFRKLKSSGLDGPCPLPRLTPGGWCGKLSPKEHNNNRIPKAWVCHYPPWCISFMLGNNSEKIWKNDITCICKGHHLHWHDMIWPVLFETGRIWDTFVWNRWGGSISDSMSRYRASWQDIPPPDSIPWNKSCCKSGAKSKACWRASHSARAFEEVKTHENSINNDVFLSSCLFKHFPVP